MIRLSELVKKYDVDSDPSLSTHVDSNMSFDSENSYRPLIQKSELYEKLTYLAFDLSWIFMTAFSSIALLIILTYNLYFDRQFIDNLIVMLIIIICDMIIVIDIAASVLHLVWTRYAAIRNLTPRSKYLISMDVISALWMIFCFTPIVQYVDVFIYIDIVFVTFRLYRVVWYFYLIAATPGYDTTFNMFKKYGIIILLLVHISTCAIQILGCKPGTPNWCNTLNEQLASNNPFSRFFVISFFVLGSATSIGSGDIHPETDSEYIVIIIVMFLGFIILDGVFLGAWTSVQIQSYSKHANFSNRLKLISMQLNHPRIPKKLKQKTKDYYEDFWKEQSGVKYSDLFNTLPVTLKNQIYLDTYWNALRQSYLMRDLHPAVQRAIASVMTTEIFTAGQFIYREGENKQIMIYLIRGAMQILSSTDGESPILSLGTGTCLGEMNLIYSVASPVHVKATTYCVIQCLTKRDFWRIVFKHKKLNQIKYIHNKLKMKMFNAHAMQELHKRHGHGQMLALKKIKYTLKTEQSRNGNSEFYDIKRNTSTSYQDSSEVYTDLYVLSLQQTAFKNADEIFLRTSWPWVLQPHSVLITLWEFLLCATILLGAIFIPYCFTFMKFITTPMELVLLLISFVFLMDLVFQMFIALETDRRLIAEVNEIIIIRYVQAQFLVDMIAWLPLEVLIRSLNFIQSDRLLSLVTSNRLIKIFQFIRFFTRVEGNFKLNLAVVRCIKYILYFVMMAYFFGCAMYMVACFDEGCYRHSWFNQVTQEDIISGGTRYKNSFHLSFTYGTIIAAMIGFGNVTPNNQQEVGLAMVLSVIGSVVFCYLIADYSATLMLAEHTRLNFVEMVLVVQRYLRWNKMLQINQTRTDEYLALQWYINMGYHVCTEHAVTYDLNQKILQDIKRSKYYHALFQVPLFQGVDSEIIKDLTEKCEEIFLPPYEIVMYAGEVVHDLYFIDKGYCEVISAASEKTEKILGPLSHFCDFDMLLERPGIHNIRTVTNATIIKLSYANIVKYFDKQNLKQPLMELAEEMKASVAVQRLFLRKGTVTYHNVREQSKPSWIKFPSKKKHPLTSDYENGFGNHTVWKFLRFVMMKGTIMPDGKFIMIWEIIQAIRIFFTGMVYIAIPIYGAYTFYIYYVHYVFDVIAIIDMYMRCHVCFYNKMGVLVTHPRNTALHYLKNAFIIDFITVLPTPWIVRLIISSNGTSWETLNAIKTIVRINKILQLYRIHGAFSYLESNIIKPRKVSLQILEFLLIILVILNALTMILLALTCNIKQNEDGYHVIKPLDNSWVIPLRKRLSYNIDDPLNLYLTAYNWVACLALSSGNSDFTVQLKSEMYFLVAVVIFGYLTFTYMIVLISSSQASIDVNLTIYQGHMTHLIRFMKKENIAAVLQKKVIDHFEYIWQRTHGMRSSKVLNKFHLALHEDCALYLYEDTFKNVPVFEDMPTSFFRLLGLHVEEMYFLRGSTIIHINDIIDVIYIIHKGEVVVYAPDNTIFTNLTCGCVFGNIDNAPHSRSTVTIVACTAIDLLRIPTEMFYKLALDFPSIQSKMKTQVLIENASYIEKKGTTVGVQTDKKLREELTLKSSSVNIKLSIKNHIIFIGSLSLPMMLSSFFSVMIAMYQLAFQNHKMEIIAIGYSLDFIHVIRLFAEFYIPFTNEMGDLVTEPTEIRKRYLTIRRFYRELFALMPFELLAFFSGSMKLYYFSWFRTNRLFRMWNIYTFFNVTYDKLNIHVVGVKMGSLIIYFSLITHIGACTLYMSACPMGNCKKDSWIGQSINNNHYIISMYVLITILTHNGFSYISPKTIEEMVLSTAMVIGGKFLTALHIGDISALVQYFSYALMKYSYKIVILKEYLGNNFVTPPLINRIMNYINNLWETGQGRQFPILLDEAPSYIIEGVKGAAYGKHLYENYVFISCHNDFLRLLSAKLKVQTFFKGDIICQQGDVNNKMYFIHKGTVDLYVIIDNEEIEMDHLQKLDCFGLVQGLFANTPHSHTYKAATLSVILTLNLHDWAYLLQYYRAARAEIYTRIQSIVDK